MSLPELNQVLDSSRTAKKEQNTFLAAIQGIDLNKGQENASDFEEVKRRAQARLAGMSEEQLEFSEIGIQIEEWEDE